MCKIWFCRDPCPIDFSQIGSENGTEISIVFSLEVAIIARLRVSAFKYGVISNYEELSCGNDH